jgi:hypothetical protein
MTAKRERQRYVSLRNKISRYQIVDFLELAFFGAVRSLAQPGPLGDSGEEGND